MQTGSSRMAMTVLTHLGMACFYNGQPGRAKQKRRARRQAG
jgi:hypothetical protein